MNKEVLDLAKDKKISDFADVVKSELKKKVLDNEYIKDKADELTKYKTVADTVSGLNKEADAVNVIADTK